MSDILIRGMEMPKGGYRTIEIGFDADGHPMALADGGDVYDVIPIPPHGRLGDLDALYEVVKKRTRNWAGGWSDIECVLTGNDIKNAPTIIEAEEGE